MSLKIKRIFAIFLLFFMGIFNSAHANAPSNHSLAPMLEHVLPTVVNIIAQIRVTDFSTLRELQKQKRVDSTGNGTYISVGSGVIIDGQQGYIITNAHVINDAQVVTVNLSDGRHFTAKIIGLDRPSDVAILQVKAKNLPTVKLGNSSQLKVGDVVAAIGSPFGLNQTVTSGIVSALGRAALRIESYEDFIQTDAPINPGNSGGALVNENGELIGINTAILAPDRGSIGIGFAIPINMARSVSKQLIEYGNVKRGALGIATQDLTPELATAFHLSETKGAVVAQVLNDSPAKTAGIEVGDIITKVNENKIKNASDVVNIVGFLRVDSKITLDIIRHHKSMTLAANLSDPKKRQELQLQNNPFFNGVSMQDFNSLNQVHGQVTGVLITGIREDANNYAWQAGLRPGDVITFANDQKISNTKELMTIAGRVSDNLLINVLRGNGAIFLVISKES